MPGYWTLPISGLIAHFCDVCGVDACGIGLLPLVHKRIIAHVLWRHCSWICRFFFFHTYCYSSGYLVSGVKASQIMVFNRCFCWIWISGTCAKTYIKFYTVVQWRCKIVLLSLQCDNSYIDWLYLSRDFCSTASEWLMFDVGPPTLVTGIVTKGRGDSRKQWVTRFRISYSNDTSIWYFYKDASHLDAKVSFIRDYYSMLYLFYSL